MVKYLKGRNSLVRNPDGDICTESDCEGEARAEDESSNMKEEEEEKARAVLITGSFATYVRSFTPALVSRGMTGSPAGNLYSFIVART